MWIIIAIIVAELVAANAWTHSKSNKYWIMWQKAVPVEAGDIKSGDILRVFMLPRRLFWWFYNVKGIAGGTGINKAWWTIPWGFFYIIFYNKEEPFVDALLNYRHSRWPFRIIRDTLRKLPDGSFIGRFNIEIRGRRFFLCWFLLKPRRKS